MEQLLRRSRCNAALARLAAGDTAALTDLYDAAGREIFALALSVTGSRHDAEDVITETGLSVELEDVIAQFPDEETYRVIVQLDFESPVSGIEEMHREALAIMGFSSEKELGNDSALWQKYHETYNDLVYGGPTQREIIYRLFPGDYEIELLSGTVSWSGEQSIEVEGAHFYAGTVIANLSESRIRELAASDGVAYITYAGSAVYCGISSPMADRVD